MGILSSLAGFIPGVGPIVSGLADVFGGAAGGGAKQDNTAQQLRAMLASAKTNQDKFALDAPKTRLNTSTRASLIGNYAPRKVDWGPGGFTPGAGARGVVPTISGGVQGGMANLDPNTKKLASTITDQELQSQLAGGGPTGTDSKMPDAPDTSTSTNILGGLGLGGSILATLQKLKGGMGGASSGVNDPSFVGPME